MNSNPYSRVFNGELPSYDTTDLRSEHLTLDRAARKLWIHLPDQVKDIIHSFALELADEQNRRKRILEKYNKQNEQIRKLENEKVILEGNMDELNSINSHHKVEIKSLLNLNEKLKWRVKSLELEIKELNTKLTVSMRDTFELRKILDTSEVTSMNTNLEIEKEFARVYEEKEALERVNAELKGEIRILQEKVNAIPKEEKKQIAPNTEPIVVDLNREIIRKLTAENAMLEEKIIELLTANKRTSALANVLIEMRKQMLNLSKM